MLVIRQSTWCWPIGLVNAALYIAVFFQARLYAGMALQAVYVVLGVYGWYAWLHGGEQGGELAVSRTPGRWAFGLGALGAVGAVAFGLFLRYRTDAALPYWDAAMTSFSLVAQFMTTRKWIENWGVWLVVDTVYVGMYVSQHLYPTALLYAAFVVLATLGLLEWRRSLAAGPAVAAPAPPEPSEG